MIQVCPRGAWFRREQQSEHKRRLGADYQDRGLIFANTDGDQPDLGNQAPNLQGRTKAEAENTLFPHHVRDVFFILDADVLHQFRAGDQLPG